jgi:predicted Rossmann fold flavoprotein
MSLVIVDSLEHGPVSVSIDLQPGINWQQLHQHLQQEFTSHGSRSYKGIVSSLLPDKMVEPFIGITGIQPEKHASQLTAEERQRLADNLKSLRFTIKESLSIHSAMVTAGGISLKEIDPRTMASRLVKGLYLCGEVLDIDGDSGGYNLQAAFSTGYVAGQHAAGFVAR